MKRKYLLVGFFFYFALAASLAHSYVASSTNYVIQSDSINFGGGFSSSTGYLLEDTLGEVATGFASSSSVLSAGYQAMNTDTYIAVSAPETATMTPAISGAGGGVSNGSSWWLVTTDNPAGYELSVRAATSPSMTSGTSSLADYVPSHSDPDYSWNTPIRESRFGFSPEGDHIVDAFRDNGVSCNAGSSDSSAKCWDGFSTSNQVIARSSDPTALTGATTTIRFRAEIGSKKPQGQGTYSASIIATAVSL